MLWSIKNGERILATPKDKAKCPLCKGKTISKCGSIKIWHWAHKSNKKCDPWYESETKWHLNWKNEFPKEQQEVVIENHRADIKCKDGTIIELQNSSISPDDIRDREKFYKKMVWLFNGEKFAKNLELKDKGDYFTFRWKHPHKSLWFCGKKLFIDLQETYPFKIIHIRKIYHNVPCGGWGLLLSKEEFLEKFNKPT